MPPARKPAAQAAQRRNPKPDDANMRTRSGGRGKSAAGKAEKNNEILSPKSSPVNGLGSSPILTRKTTRSSSNVSTYSQIVVGGSGNRVHATYEKPVLRIANLTREFLANLKDSPPKNQKVSGVKAGGRNKLVLSFAKDGPFSELDDASESAPSPEPTPVRRGRGGGRGGRGRGRGRGRGNARKEAFPDKHVQVSPKKNRPTRTAAPAFPLTEVEEDSPSNQESPYESAKESIVHHNEPSPNVENGPETDRVVEPKPIQDVQHSSTTPKGTPPPGLQTPESPTPAPQDAPSRGSQSEEQVAPTPKDESSATPAEPAQSQMVNPEDDVLTDADLLSPFITNAIKPSREECEDEADYLLNQRYEPMNDPAAIVAALTKYPPSARSDEVLWALALNAQKTLRVWQDQFLKLDAKVCITPIKTILCC